jgi:fumarate reductase subunit D
MKYIKKLLLILPFGLTPSIAFAYRFDNITQLINYIYLIIRDSILRLIFALAVLAFFWGVFKTIRDANDSKAREEGRYFMLYGIIAIFVMVSMWGLVRVLTNTFGIPFTLPFIHR